MVLAGLRYFGVSQLYKPKKKRKHTLNVDAEMSLSNSKSLGNSGLGGTPSMNNQPSYNNTSKLRFIKENQ